MRLAGLLVLLWLAQPVAAQNAAEQLGVLFDRDRPIDVRSDEFEAERGEGAGAGDRVVFRGKVVALQDPTRLSCDWLEARYPAGGGAPERLTARGNVQLTGNASRMECGELIYDGPACRLTCRRGEDPAAIQRGDDLLRGDEIELDLCSDTVRVRGGAAIRVSPGRDAAGGLP
jgi:lipopolysaccharide export system protein LptA